MASPNSSRTSCTCCRENVGCASSTAVKSPHPGRLIRNTCLEPLGLSVTTGADALKIARPTLSNVVNGKAAISAEMAIRLEKAFGGTADAWPRMQTAFDLAQARL
ncbi:MAG: addiction module antidote protein, HigA family [Rhodospirillaceae bacterium]|nr:addiction module antidote protein, HigA family [Rhodospirillaceae bacterium]